MISSVEPAKANECSTNGKKLSAKELISYGAGDFSSNLVWGFIGSYLLFFYTNVAMIPVVATGTLFLIARGLDAFIDPVIGGFVDRTNSKIGRTIPYMRYGAIPLAILLILTFSYVPGPDLMKIIFAYVTYIVVGILYSIVNVPYGALMPLMTRDTGEKAKLACVRIAGASVGSILITGLAMPIVKLLGGDDQRLGFVLTAAIFSVVMVIGFEIVSRNCKERFLEKRSSDIKRDQKRSIAKTYRNALHNRPWVICVLFALLFFIRIGVTIAITIYFAMYVLKQPALISVLLPMLYVGQLISTTFSAKMIGKWGHRTANIIGNIGFLVALFILPLVEGNIIIFLVVYLVGNTIGAVSSASVFGMVADSVDYNEAQFGERSEGTLYAGYSFATKVGMAIGSALAGYALTWMGFNAAHVTTFFTSQLNIAYFAIQIILTSLTIVIVLFYDLDARHQQIVELLSERAASSER